MMIVIDDSHRDDGNDDDGYDDDDGDDNDPVLLFMIIHYIYRCDNN